MSDHIDGPRQIGDPSADLTDLFAFTSPENPAHTILAANVFPTCGADANGREGGGKMIGQFAAASRAAV
jgi:hypothetical protein